MRGPNPQRIYEAKREGRRSRMVASWHVPEADADALLDAWDAEAGGRELARTIRATGRRARSGCAIGPG